MPVVISPASELGKELRKWEQHHTRYAIDEEGSSVPGNPYAYRHYPMMLYKARKLPNGQTKCLVPPPQAYEFEKMDQYERAVLFAESFNASCQLTVKSETDHAKALNEGWRASPSEALAHADGLEQDIARAAAEAAHSAQRMSAKAQAEFEAAGAETHKHVVDLVGAKKRGRPAKTKPVAQAPEIG
jgi:hypothetical protein